MLLLLRSPPPPAAASASASAIPISSFSTAPPPPFSTTSRSSFSSTLRCSVGNLSPVLFEPLRTDALSDPTSQHGHGDGDGVCVAAASTDTQEQDQKQHGDDEEDKGISGIHVPRQRYIAVPKAALLDALLSLFPSQPAAADFNRFARCLDAVLHAEHKEMLEEMRTYYMLTLPNPGEDEQSRFMLIGKRQLDLMP